MDHTTSYWSFACPRCKRMLVKQQLVTPWKCWGCSWSTEDVDRGHLWDGISQKPSDVAGEPL